MRVLLVNLWRDPRERMFPLKLAGIAAVLKAEGHDVVALDVDLERRMPFQGTGAPCPDAAVLLACSETWPRVREMFAGITPDRQRLIAVGGAHATLFSDEVLAQPGVDAVFRGEGEQIASRMLRAWRDRSPTSIPGVIWQQRWLEAGLVSQHDFQRIEHLDKLPDADRSLFRIDAYTGMATRRARYTQVVAGRGRNRDCHGSPLGRLLPGGRRNRSVRRVVAEMAAIRDRFGIDEFHFENEALFEDRPYVQELCEAIRRELPGVLWQCPAGNHPDDVPIELLEELAAAGCYRIYVEPHSPHPAGMELLGWPWDVGRLRWLATEARRVGIELGGYFTIALPGESIEEMEAVVKFAVDSELSWAQFTPFRFAAGSLLAERKDELSPRLPAEATVRRVVGRAYRRFYGSHGRWAAVLRSTNRRNALQIFSRAYGKFVLGRSP